MQKSRKNTEQRILRAVETLLRDQGFSEVGINSIARTAGCDKVLIYRYFGGFEGLLERFAGEHTLWWDAREIMPDETPETRQMSLPEFLEALLKRHIAAVRALPLAQEIMAWEMSASNTLTRALNRTRSEQGMLLVKLVRRRFDNPSIDIGGILGIFGTAVNYLVIRTRHQQSEYATEEWWRLEQTISSLLQCQAQSKGGNHP